MAPDAGSLLHGYVTAISKSVEKRLETIKQPANGACGLRVWKVAQLVEQEAIPSPRFDSWLSDFTRIIVTKLTAVNAFSTRHPRGCLFILSKYKNSTTKKVSEKSGVFSWKGVLRNGENDRKTKEILRRISH